MRFIKRSVFFFMLFAFIVPALVFAGGSKASSSSSSEKVQKAKKPLAGITLKCAFIGGANYDQLYQSIPEFEKETGAKVQIIYKGDGFQIDKKLTTDFAAGTVDYDVCWDHTSFFSKYVKVKGIVPLDQYYTKAELSDFVPMILKSCYKNGHLWLIPRHFDISALHYRTDIFDNPKWQKKYKDLTGKDLEVPKTWDEFKETAINLQKLLPPGMYATQFAGKEEALTGRFYEILLAEGGQFFDKNWKPAFNGPAGVKAATMLHDLYKAGAMPPGMTNFVWANVAKNWVAGNIAFYTEWYGWYSYFEDPKSSKVAGKFDLARQPEGDGHIHSGWAGAHAFSITAASKHKKAAAEFVKFITNKENQYREAKLGFLPVRNSVWEMIINDAKKSGKPLDVKRLKLARLQAKEDFRTPPLIAEWIPASNIVYPILQQIILGDKKPKEGLDEAAKKVEAMMRNAGYYNK